MTTNLYNGVREGVGAIRGSSAVYPDLEGKVAVVTGAGRGMGACFVEGLAERGVRVVAADIDAAMVEETVARLSAAIPGSSIVATQMDVAVQADHERVAQLALSEFGQLDYWLNNAGIFPYAEIPDIDEEHITRAFAVNLNGVLLGSQAAAKAMGDRGGAIVNTSSGSAARLRTGRAAYSTSKGAVDNLTRALANEYGGRGIRVNAVSPGFVNTDMLSWIRDDPARLAAAAESVPARRIGEPEDVLNAILFLISDSASYVTGTTLHVDGGSRNVSTAN